MLQQLQNQRAARDARFRIVRSKYVEQLWREMEATEVIPARYLWNEWSIERVENPLKSHDDRFKLFCFLFNNGVEPEIAGHFVLWWDGRMPPEYCHPVSVRHITDVSKMVKDARMPAASRERYRLVKNVHWDTIEQRAVPGYFTYEEYLQSLQKPPEPVWYKAGQNRW